MRRQGPGDTPSRRRIFVCGPTNPDEEDRSARRILSTLMRRAYRRPVTDADLQGPLEFYRQARTEAGFEAGIEMAAVGRPGESRSSCSASRQDPAGLPANTAYRISDLELASRLSFFLWSSIPDDELLDVAIRGKLHEPAVLERQVRRMLADSALAERWSNNFADSGFTCAISTSITPDMRLFPDFDDNLRQAFRQETELFFESILREDRSVLDLLKANYTFVNERLAKHYGIPNVYGSRFRRVTLDAGQRARRPAAPGQHPHRHLLRDAHLAGDSRQVDSRQHPRRPPPPPPPNVPALKDNTVDRRHLSVRERLAEHRAMPPARAATT